MQLTALILSEEHGNWLQKAIVLHTTSLFTAQTTPNLAFKKAHSKWEDSSLTGKISRDQSCQTSI